MKTSRLPISKPTRLRKKLVAPLEALEASLPLARGRRVVRWILRQLLHRATLATEPDKVPA